MRLLSSLVLIAHLVAPSAGVSAAPRPPAPVLKKLTACRAIADDHIRLACLDREVDALTSASRSGEVVVAERKQLREDMKAGFGLGETRRRTVVEGEEQTPPSVSSTIVNAHDRGYGSWDYTLANGMHWRQVEASDGLPRAGQAVTITKASLGSYFLKIGKGRAVRVVRTQ